MPDRRSIEDLEEIGAGRPAPDDVVRLYRQAFREFGAPALWDRRPSDRPTIAQALVVAGNLHWPSSGEIGSAMLESERKPK